MAKVSIVIPVYNVEKYLRRCLESVVNQTLQDIEIILVNDGSKDGSLAICEEYAEKDSRIKVISKENAGLGAARNTGLQHVTSEYVGFIDSDDWVALDFYEKLYNTAVENNCDIAYGDVVRKSDKIHKIRLNLKEVLVSEDTSDKINNSRHLNSPNVWSRIYRKALLDNNSIGFPEGKLFEDGLFTAKAIYYANKIVSVPNTFYYYFVNQKSIVKSRKTQKKTDDRFITEHDMLNFYKSVNVKLKPDEFLTVAFKLKFMFLTLWVIKEDLYSKKYYLFGSIPIKTIKKGV